MANIVFRAESLCWSSGACPSCGRSKEEKLQLEAQLHHTIDQVPATPYYSIDQVPATPYQVPATPYSRPGTSYTILQYRPGTSYTIL